MAGSNETATAPHGPFALDVSLFLLRRLVERLVQDKICWISHGRWPDSRTDGGKELRPLIGARVANAFGYAHLIKSPCKTGSASGVVAYEHLTVGAAKFLCDCGGYRGIVER